MIRQAIALRVRPYDHICPLLLGQVETPSMALSFEINGPLEMNFPDRLQAAEVSFNRYVLSYALGQDDLIGLPAWILRGFRHRNYFVRSDSPLRSLADLRGKRLATNSWGDTGTLWARAALRDAGVQMDEINWVVGPLDHNTPGRKGAAFEAPMPEGTTRLEDGDTLMDALEDGRIDAITTAFAPNDIFQPGGRRVRRLVEDYVEVEKDYHLRTGIYPTFHIIALRRSYARENPQVVVDLYKALKSSWDIWWLKARRFSETGPWAMAEHETMARSFPQDTPPFGLSSPTHRKMLQVMCAEQKAQNMVKNAADPDRLFTGFLEALDQLGLREADLLETS